MGLFAHGLTKRVDHPIKRARLMSNRRSVGTGNCSGAPASLVLRTAGRTPLDGQPSWRERTCPGATRIPIPAATLAGYARHADDLQTVCRAHRGHGRAIVVARRAVAHVPEVHLPIAVILGLPALHLSWVGRPVDWLAEHGDDQAISTRALAAIPASPLRRQHRDQPRCLPDHPSIPQRCAHPQVVRVGCFPVAPLVPLPSAALSRPSGSLVSDSRCASEETRRHLGLLRVVLQHGHEHEGAGDGGEEDGVEHRQGDVHEQVHWLLALPVEQGIRVLPGEDIQDQVGD